MAMEQRFKGEMEARMNTSPGYRKGAEDILRKLQSGGVPQVDFFFQGDRHEPDIYEAAFVLELLVAGETGGLAGALIPVGSTPSADAEYLTNGRKLEALPPPFKATVWEPTTYEADGSLSWSEPVLFGTGILGLSDRQDITCLPRRGVSLEIGTTNASTTWWHLWQERMLARWPYGRDVISVHWCLGDFLRGETVAMRPEEREEWEALMARGTQWTQAWGSDGAPVIDRLLTFGEQMDFALGSLPYSRA
jgi:hypothetical protein